MSLQDLWQLLMGRKEGPGRQVRVWWLVGLAALGAMLMILSGTGGAPKTQPATTSRPKVVADTPQDGVTALQTRLQSVLSQVAGAGRVEVEIHLADNGRTEFATNVNKDRKSSSGKDSGGTSNATSDLSENDQVVLNQGGEGGAPVIKRQLAPQVDGVLIVADGAGDPAVRAALAEAAAVALHVPSYEIVVLPRGGA